MVVTYHRHGTRHHSSFQLVVMVVVGDMNDLGYNNSIPMEPIRIKMMSWRARKIKLAGILLVLWQMILWRPHSELASISSIEGMLSNSGGGGI